MKLTIFKLPPANFYCFSCAITLIALLLNSTIIRSQQTISSHDLTETLSSKADALCGPLEIITLCTNQPDSLTDFFEKGWGLRKQGPFAMNVNEKRQLAKQWHLPRNANFQLMYFDRPAAPGTILLRVLIFEEKQPLSRISYGSRENGPFTIGFPNAKQEQVHEKMLSLGYSTLAPMQAAFLSKPDGTKYRYLETIYMGPEWLHAVGIERGNGMPQLSNVDSVTGLGGPGYSAMNVTGMSDLMIAFLTNVLGYELRRDQVWTTSNGSAMGLPAGLPFRFVIAYAKGATSGHFLLLDFLQQPPVASHKPAHLPYRGIGMYSVATDNMEEVLTRAIQSGIRVLSPPKWCRESIRGSHKSMLLVAPNQVYIEVIERKK